MFKRIFSIIISLLMLFSAISAEELSENTFPIYENIASDEVCSFLVELEGGGVLERRQNGSMPLNGYEKSRSYTELENIQTSALKSVSKVTDTVPKGQLTHIMNGIIVDGSNTDLEQLKSLPNVKAVHILPNLYTIEPVSSIPAIETNAAISDFDKLQTEPIKLDSVKNQYTGDGMVIGIIDSELWYDHPVFQTEPQNPKLSIDDISNLLNTNNFIAESKINTAEKVLTANDVYINSKIPFAFDYANNDCNPKSDNEDRYHGTHVAGIAAASSEDYSGIARDAQIVFAKVAFDDAAEGEVDTESALSALDDMVKLDVDIINMSFGITAGFSDGGTIFNDIFKRLETSGICVVASAGNAGRFGNLLNTQAPLTRTPDYGLISQPATCEYSTAVASLSMPFSLSDPMHYFTLADGCKIDYYDTSFQFCGTTFTSVIDNKTIPYVNCGKGTESDFNAIDDLTEKVALITRGGAAFSDSVDRAEAKGAIAAIILNTDSTNPYIEMNISGCNIPCVCVAPTDSNKILNADVKTLTAKQRALAISSFSSYGATPDLRIKPEVTAVGSSIYSSAYSNGYAFMDGTSQAAPQYAGACASVLDYIRTKVNPLMPKHDSHIFASRLLASTATPLTRPKNSNIVPVSPRAQGAGVINLEAATTSPSLLYNTYNGKTKVELGQLSGNTFSFDFTVQNFSDHSVTYNLTADVITDDYKTTIIDGQTVNIVDSSCFLEAAQITFNCDEKLTISPHHNKTVTATITINENELSGLKGIFENGFFIEGFIYLTSGTAPALSLPFMGFYGDWCNLPIFEDNEYNLNTDLHSSYTPTLFNDNDTQYFSPNIGTLGMHFQNIRNISNFTFHIYNQKEQLVYRVIGAPRRKIIKYDDCTSFGNFNGKYATDTDIPDGFYTAVLTAYPDCENASSYPQQLIFNMYMDRVAPQLTNAYLSNINNSSERWLKITACDLPSNGPKRYTVVTPTSSEIPALYLEETGEYTFNLTGYPIQNCKIQLVDAAFNTTQYNITEANGYAKSFSDGKCTDIESFNALLTNGLFLNRFDHNANTDGTQKSLYAFDKNLKPLTQPYDVTEN